MHNQRSRGLSMDAVSASGDISDGRARQDSTAGQPKIKKRISSKGYQTAKDYASQQPSTHLSAPPEPDYESWDDFLKAYSQGHFPDDAKSRPRGLGPDLPPFPPYARALTQSQPPPFLAAPLPPNEERRLQALYSFQILETGTDLNFDRIAQLVATVLGVSGCMICLVDQESVAIKAHHRAANMECRREVSLSGHAILRAPDDPLVVLDATKDWRFNGLPAVKGGPLVRFYAGAALSTPDGNNIGSLCVIDPQPRATFTEKERLLLVNFAAVVMREMTLWNDQVSLCTRTRMMRDITCWVRACLDMTEDESLSTPAPSPESAFARRASIDISQARLTPSPDGTQPPGSVSSTTGSPVNRAHGTYSSPDATMLPTPTRSPTLLPKELKTGDRKPSLGNSIGILRQDGIRDRAFPLACNMIQATLNADAVYLVQAGSNKSFIPQAGSGVSWNLWKAKTRTKGAVGAMGGAESIVGQPGLVLECLASSTRQCIDEPIRNVRRQGTSWVCAEGSCRPHRIRDFQQDIAGPVWERDLPVIAEAMSYVRQQNAALTRQPGQSPLYTCCPGSEENDWFESSRASTKADDSVHPGLLCHTFQGTLPEFEAGPGSPYRSCVIMPIRGASSADYTRVRDDEPWAYVVVLNSSPTKQFLQHERIYLKNFGSCLVTEVMKRRVEAADKAKGIFIKNISHELRTPLHIILGILELLQANTEEALTEQQVMMLGSAEASGKGLIDTINNIIDLADLDSSNRADVEQGRKQLSDLFTNISEIDIRELCEQVAGSMTKRCVDKNLVINPSWSQHELAGLSVRSDDQKSSLEVLVATDELERVPGEDIHWNFIINIPMVRRILTQLLENAIKFTTTGFVEISAVSPPLNMIPLKPPHPDARPVLFTVRDTGRGIQRDYIQTQLFERFSQEDPLQAGTGLGLALVKLLVESLGGWLEVWSEGIEGKGCVVRILIWATPATVDTGSLRDEEGLLQQKSCRFYLGDASVGSDRLWTILGERLMGQDFGMVVERGDELDVSPVEMLKDLKDQARCDLLVFNDDLGRLKTYLSHWADHHRASSRLQQSQETPPVNVVPTPLLMLTSASKERRARGMVDAYMKVWKESASPLDTPARVVIMTKPTGPLKLMHSLRDCFTDSTFKSSNGNSLDMAFTSHSLGESILPQKESLLTCLTLLQTPPQPTPPQPQPLPFELKQEHEQSGAKHKTRRSIRKFMGGHLNGSSRIGSRNINTKGASGPSSLATGNCSSSDAFGQPLLPKPAAIPKGQPSSSSSFNKDNNNSSDEFWSDLRVLIVEDNVTNRMILRTFFKKKGVAVVVEAENGQIGVDRFVEELTRQQVQAQGQGGGGMRAKGFDYVLMDLQMPVMDGNMATKRIREAEQRMIKKYGLSARAAATNSTVVTATSSVAEGGSGLSNTQGLSLESRFGGQGGEVVVEEDGYCPSMIFALTGLAGEEDKRLAFECGVDGYLTKPVSLKGLGQLLTSCHRAPSTFIPSPLKQC
ncbi:His Kinase A domain containing protein [Mortierella sp. GBA35]|nr:His Kinase A domain containing protein [Mortierella sp. GBA35]